MVTSKKEAAPSRIKRPMTGVVVLTGGVGGEAKRYFCICRVRNESHRFQGSSTHLLEEAETNRGGLTFSRGSIGETSGGAIFCLSWLRVVNL